MRFLGRIEHTPHAHEGVVADFPRHIQPHPGQAHVMQLAEFRICPKFGRGAFIQVPTPPRRGRGRALPSPHPLPVHRINPVQLHACT